MLVLETFVGLHRTVQVLQHYWLGHRLGLLWYWMVCLGKEPGSFCHFCDWTQVQALIICCWTMSNLPWFMVLTFQVPMQYCSLLHQTLLPSPATSTSGCCFPFGSVSSFFLELFLHWSPVVYWAPTNLGSLSFSVLSSCLFIQFIGFSRQEYCSGLPFPSPVLCQNSPPWPIHLWWPYKACLIVLLS